MTRESPGRGLCGTGKVVQWMSPQRTLVKVPSDGSHPLLHVHPCTHMCTRPHTPGNRATEVNVKMYPVALKEMHTWEAVRTALTARKEMAEIEPESTALPRNN